MNDNLITLLLFIAVGMIIAILIKPTYQYHGPNAEKHCQKKFYCHLRKKCYQFDIYPIECPKPISTRFLNFLTG